MISSFMFIAIQIERYRYASFNPCLFLHTNFPRFSNFVRQVVSLLGSLDNFWMLVGEVLADWVVEGFLSLYFLGCLRIISDELVLCALAHRHLLCLFWHVVVSF